MLGFYKITRSILWYHINQKIKRCERTGGKRIMFSSKSIERYPLLDNHSIQYIKTVKRISCLDFNLQCPKRVSWKSKWITIFRKSVFFMNILFKLSVRFTVFNFFEIPNRNGFNSSLTNQFSPMKLCVFTSIQIEQIWKMDLLSYQ